MSKFTEYAERAVKFVRSRLGAVLLLTICSVICAVGCSSYLTEVNVVDGDVTRTFFTARTEPADIVLQSGAVLAGGDDYELTYSADSRSTELHIIRAMNVTVCDGGVETVYEVVGGTVADLLERENIVLGADDMINISTALEVADDMYINIDRVTYVDTTTAEIISCKTIKVDSDELLKGETRTVTAGSDGVRTVVTRQTYINGVLASSDRISEEVTTPVINRVVQVGTAESLSGSSDSNTAADSLLTGNNTSTAATFIDSAGRSVAYRKIMTGKGVGYTAEVGTKTATGREVELGIVAVDPSVIPYGTRLYITSADGKYVYGYALAADSGEAALSGDMLLELFFETSSQCRVFGKRDIVVYVLE